MNAPAQHIPSDYLATGPRLVLISAEPDAKSTGDSPVRILGSRPRMQGHFRLTDR